MNNGARVGLAVVVAAVVVLSIVLVLRKGRRAAPPAPGNGQLSAPVPAEEKIYSLVYLLRQPRDIDLPTVTAAAERAFNRQFNAGDETLAVIATPRPSHFIVRMPELVLGVMSVGGTYVKDIGEAAEQTRDFRQKKAMQEHTAWLAVDLLDDPPASGPEAAYPYIGKLLAELAGDDCLAIYCTSPPGMNSYGPELLPLLRGNDPLQAISFERPMKIATIRDDDPRLLAATEEARRRWPEFVDAFNRRRPLQGFAVKVPFSDPGIEKREHMWVEVSEISETRIRGKLVSNPESVRFVKLNDPVEVKVQDIKDWIYSDGAQMVGGFTAKVLEQMEQERGDNSRP